MNEDLYNKVKSKLLEQCENCGGETDEMCVVEKESVDYAVEGIKKEIALQLSTFPLEALYFINYMFKKEDFQAELEVEDFVAFVRSVTRLLPMERKKEVLDYTKEKVDDFLQIEIHQELTRKITDLIQKSLHENSQLKEMDKRYGY